MENTIQIIINTLNQIEVKGKQNLDHLLGAIIALENLAKQVKQETEKPRG